MHFVRHSLPGPDREPALTGDRAAVRVIGVGNPLRGDDAAGLEAVRRLGQVPAGIDVICHEGDGSGLLELWWGAAAVLVVDAVRTGAAPGTVHRYEAGTAPLPDGACSASTHTVSVAGAIELARALGCLPPTVVVFGVEGAEFAVGAELSDPVAAAIGSVAGLVAGEARQMADAHG
jgi:hydrogenase maturation protease